MQRGKSGARKRNIGEGGATETTKICTIRWEHLPEVAVKERCHKRFSCVVLNRLIEWDNERHLKTRGKSENEKLTKGA